MAGETEHYDHDDAEALPKAEELADIFSLDLSQFTLGNVIGRGHFSTVLLAKRKDDKDRDGALFAVKRQVGGNLARPKRRKLDIVAAAKVRG
mmetsp:Transcript_13689/g.51035  ORF Transcript_13689/g.51035 Transcript_13689/m.51035 type:complete len:92 (+) Transcript_13689:317-592(+)